jgi:hypothetical protein
MADRETYRFAGRVGETRGAAMDPFPGATMIMRLAFCAGCLLVFQGAQSQESKPAADPNDVYVFHFDAARGRPGVGVTLLDFLREMIRVEPRAFVITDAAANDLERALLDIRGGVTVPKKSVGEFLEATLAAHNFALVPIGRPSMKLWLVTRPPAKFDDPLRGATFVPHSAIGEYVGRPATLVATVIPVFTGDPKEICQALTRGHYSSQSEVSAAPIGNHSVIITGLGPHVAAFAQLVTAADMARADSGEARERLLAKSIAELEARVAALEKAEKTSAPEKK